MKGKQASEFDTMFTRAQKLAIYLASTSIIIKLKAKYQKHMFYKKKQKT